jgi:ribosomal protection tetracycline resistance protein
VADGPPSRRGPTSTARDFRKLSLIVLRRALEEAGTVLCEPLVKAKVEVPSDAVATTTAAIARLGGAVRTSGAQVDMVTLETILSTADAQRLRKQLPELTGGEGALETTYARHAPRS